MAKKPRAPKGLITFEKLLRMSKIGFAAEKRVYEIKKAFNSLPSSKKLRQDTKSSLIKAEKMVANKPLNKSPVYDENLKLLITKNAVNNLLYFQAFKEFAAEKNANHKFLKRLDKLIDLAQDTVVKAREWTP